MSEWLTPELIELTKKARKEGINHAWIQEAVQEMIKEQNKPVGTNYQIYITEIKKKIAKRNEKNQFNESMIGVEIETHQDGKIHWLQFLAKRK